MSWPFSICVKLSLQQIESLLVLDPQKSSLARSLGFHVHFTSLGSLVDDFLLETGIGLLYLKGF